MATILVTASCANIFGVRAASRSTQQFRNIFSINCCNRMSISNLQDNIPMRYTSCSGAAFIHSSSLAISKSNYHEETYPKTIQPTTTLQFINRYHTTTKLMARKRNGGKRKKAKLQPTTRRSKQAIDGDDDMIQTSNTNILEKMLEEDSFNDDQEEITTTSEFIPRFASEYHAPVMPEECINALLQQGDFGDMLQARKEKWRKKKSILDAKRRKAGYYEDDDHDEVEEGDIEKEKKAPLTISQSPDQHPRIFIDGTLGGGGHSQALLQQLKAGDILLGCDVDPEALSTASTRLKEYLGTSEYILGENINGDLKCGWEEERPMFIPVQSNFRNLVTALSQVRHPVSGKLLLGKREQSTDDGTTEEEEVEFPIGVHGMLLDLGVSSHQIDEAEESPR